MIDKKLHGNLAKIDPKEDITPLFTGYMITNQKEVKNGEVYAFDSASVELSKKEVDMNHK